ncbi:hypothetical protein KAT63_04465 [Candidatus Parcubacteria bacterium]|nr:hypothetical protein [Candidatus Parcubacteria bacterium]
MYNMYRTIIGGFLNKKVRIIVKGIKDNELMTGSIYEEDDIGFSFIPENEHTPRIIIPWISLVRIENLEINP